MTRYRTALPQTDNRIFMMDGGIETTLVFHEGVDLPCFAAFDLLKDEDGRKRLERYYERYASFARDQGVGLILDSVTWRASPDWGKKLGYTSDALAKANREAIELLETIRDRFETEASPMIVGAVVGPRGDGYKPGELMTIDAARDYHAFQINTFAGTGADMVTAYTLTNAPEAIGITNAARDAGLPVAISFTVETDSRLPTGQPLGDAINAVDDATGATPAYYMINCAHPTHFAKALNESGSWVSRLRGLRANASRRSHAELDEATELDDGNPVELGAQYADLRQRFPHFSILGGCCGTDHRHIEQIYESCKAAA